MSLLTQAIQAGRGIQVYSVDELNANAKVVVSTKQYMHFHFKIFLFFGHEINLIKNNQANGK